VGKSDRDATDRNTLANAGAASSAGPAGAGDGLTDGSVGAPAGRTTTVHIGP